MSGIISHSQTIGNGALWYLDVCQSGVYSELASGSVCDSSEVVDLAVFVSVGDEIVFSVDANGGAACDFVDFNVIYQAVPEGGVDVTTSPYFADASGVTDCTAAVNAALTDRDDVFFPSGTYLLNGTVSVPDEKTISGQSGAESEILVGNGTAFVAGSSNRFQHLLFSQAGSVGCDNGVIQIDDRADVTVSNCVFDIVWLAGRGVVARHVEQLSVLNCRSVGTHTRGLLDGYDLTDSLICGNDVRGWRSLMLHGTTRCVISNNVVGGVSSNQPGITGICYTSSQGEENVADENNVTETVIVGNVVEHVFEEGISFDCTGNEARRTQNPYKPLVHFYAKQAGDKITVDEVNGKWQSVGWPDGWADGCYVVVLSGADIGAYEKVVVSGGGSLRGYVKLASECDWIDRLTTNDVLMVTTGFFGNRIENNVVMNTGRTGITLHGSCWNNSVSSNVIAKSGSGDGCWFGVWGGIQIASPTMTGSDIVNDPGVMFSGFNQIVGNTVETYADPTYSNDWAAIQVITLIGSGKNLNDLAEFFPPTDHLTPGNVVRENVILNRKPILINKGYATEVSANSTPAYSGEKIRITQSDYSSVTDNYQGALLMTTAAGDIIDAGGNEGLVAD